MEEAILALERNEEENVVVTEPLDTNGLARFCSALRSSRRVKHLILRGLRLRPDGVEKIMAALQGNQTLTGLDLSFNELGDAGIKAVLIPLALGGSSSARGLHTLILDSNGLDDHGSKVLALLGNAHPLRKVSLRCNRLADQAAAMIAGALPGESVLEELDLRDNNISSNGAAGLLGMIDRGRGCLRALHLHGNPRIDSKVLQEVEHKMSQAPRTPSPRKAVSTREKNSTRTPTGGRGADLTSEEVGGVLNEMCDRLQNSIDNVCVQVKKEAGELQRHESILEELCKDLMDGVSKPVNVRGKAIEGSFLHTHEHAHEESVPVTICSMLQKAALQVAASSKEMQSLNTRLYIEKMQIASLKSLMQQHVSFSNTIAWKQASLRTPKVNGRRLFALEAELIDEKSKVDRLHDELKAKERDLDIREQRIAQQYAALDSERASIRSQEQRGLTSEETSATQENMLREKSALILELEHRLSTTEEALRNKTEALEHLEGSVRSNTEQLAAAEQLVLMKIDQAADEQAQARAKGLRAQAMMKELEEMLGALEGSRRNATEMSSPSRETPSSTQVASYRGIAANWGGVELGSGFEFTVPGNASRSAPNDESVQHRADLLHAREREFRQEMASLTQMHAELQASWRELEVSRFEQAERHARTSALQAELDQLHAEVRQRESQAQEGFRAIEEVLILLEAAAESNDKTVLAFMPARESDAKNERPLSPSATSHTSGKDVELNDKLADPADASQQRMPLSSGMSAKHAPESVQQLGGGVSGTWTHRAAKVKRSFEQTMLLLKAFLEQRQSKDEEWRQTVADMQDQVAHSNELREEAQKLRNQLATLKQEQVCREREQEEERVKAQQHIESVRAEQERRESDLKRDSRLREDELQQKLAELEESHVRQEVDLTSARITLEEERCELAAKLHELESIREANAAREWRFQVNPFGMLDHTRNMKDS